VIRKQWTASPGVDGAVHAYPGCDIIGRSAIANIVGLCLLLARPNDSKSLYKFAPQADFPVCLELRAFADYHFSPPDMAIRCGIIAMK
jgi:hypothetical protein